jgi:serine/threonine protein kinase/outer membrane protein assembly factor BamB
VQPLEPGDPGWVGAYRVLARIGLGGMGAVYLGRSPGGRPVAIKLVRDGLGADQRVRFHREVAAARQVTGTFTAPVLDADPDAPTPWLVTAYLPGLSLREAVRTYGPLPSAGVRALAAGLAEALAAIHRARVVHRDFKPSNVILTAGGPRVIDFGIVRPQDATSITRGDGFLGSPGFTSPEQISGAPISSASDIFTYGAVLAFAATGTEVFGLGHWQERLRRVTLGQADLSGIADGWAHQLITDCLQQDPARRPTAGQLLRTLGPSEVSLQGTGWLPGPMAEEIDRRTSDARQLPATPAVPPVLDPSVMGQPTLDPTFGVAEPQPEPRVRSRRALLLGGIGAGLLVAGGTTAGVLASWPRGSVNAATAEKPSATPSPPVPQATVRWKARAGAFYPDLMACAGGLVLVWTDQVLYAMDPGNGRIRWSRPSLRGAVDGGVVLSTDAASWKVSAIRAAGGSTIWSYGKFGEFPGQDFAVTGGMVCYGTSQLRAVSLATGQSRWTSAVNSPRSLVAAGSVIAVLDEKGASIVGLDAATGRKKWAYSLRNAYSLASDGLTIFTTDESSQLHAVRAVDGKRLWLQPLDLSFGLQCGGGMIYGSSFRGGVMGVRAATGEIVWATQIGHGEGAAAGTSNVLTFAEKRVYVNGTDKTTYALDAATGRILWTYAVDATHKTGPAVLGELVFVGSWDGTVHAITAPGGVSAGP